MASEKEVRLLKKGALIKMIGGTDDPERIVSIVFDDPNDLRNRGDRVTINGYYWNYADIDVLEY